MTSVFKFNYTKEFDKKREKIEITVTGKVTPDGKV